MKTTAIIAEYNPFHNGHLYQMTSARKRTGADKVIAVLSGDYTQRGEPAVIDKYSRTMAALCAGADLVIMMPVSVATSGAGQYALGCVRLLDALGKGIVDSLNFGSECGTIGSLQVFADFLADPPAEYEEYLKTFIGEGMTYALARQRAFERWEGSGADRYGLMDASILQKSNNVLGIEYLRSLFSEKSMIVPSTVTRIGADHDSSRDDVKDRYLNKNILSGMHSASERTEYASAGEIRRLISKSAAAGICRRYMPEQSYQSIRESSQTGAGAKCPVTADDYSAILNDRLTNLSSEEIAGYYECSPELAQRIKKNSGKFDSFTGFAKMLRTKEVTYSRISRILMHIVLGIKSAPERAEYIRVLGFRDSAQPLLHEISMKAEVPVITKTADAEKLLSEEALSFFRQDVLAADIYSNVVQAKFGTRMTDEYRTRFPIIHDTVK